MSYDFRPAKRENTQLIIGAAGASGSGKTYTLLMLALGLAYPEASNAEELNAIIEREGRHRIAFIDTERGRGLHYAPPPGEKPDPWREKGAWFAFDYAALEPPYRPDRYTEVVEAADGRGYVVIIVDSLSHEWAGEGGVLEWHEAEQYEKAKRKANRGGGGDKEPSWGDLEAVKMTAWIKPKMAHKRMVGRLTTLRAHLLVGLRAEQKVQFVQDYDAEGNKLGKEKIVAAKDLPPKERWFPVCEKSFPFELTISFVLGPEAPGVPHYIKLQDQHAPFVEVEGCALSMASGRQLAGWAKGAIVAGGTAAPGKRSPEALTDAYIRGLAPPPDGQVESLDDLASYQTSASKFLTGLRDRHPTLHKRCLDANVARFNELSSSPEEGGPSSAIESEGLEGSDSLFPERD